MSVTYNKMNAIKIGGPTVNSIDSGVTGIGLSLDLSGNAMYRGNNYFNNEPYIYDNTTSGYKLLKDYVGSIGPSGGTGATGTSAFTWQNIYSSIVSYSINDVVFYNGSSYICIQNSTGNDPTNTSYWNLMSQKGDTGPTGPQGISGVTGPAGAQGATGPAGAGASFFGSTGTNIYTTNSGNFGVGTTNPTRKLHVVDDINTKILYLNDAETATVTYGAIKLDDNIQRRKVILQQSSGIDNGFQFVGFGTASGPKFKTQVKDNTWDFEWAYGSSSTTDVKCFEYTTGNATFNVVGNLSVDGTNINLTYGRLASTNTWSNTNTFSSAPTFSAALNLNNAASRINQSAALTTPNQIKYTFINGFNGSSSNANINNNAGLHLQYSRDTTTPGYSYIQNHRGGVTTHNGGFIFQRYNGAGVYIDSPLLIQSNIILGLDTSVQANLGTTGNLTVAGDAQITGTTTQSGILSVNGTLNLLSNLTLNSNNYTPTQVENSIKNSAGLTYNSGTGTTTLTNLSATSISTSTLSSTSITNSSTLYTNIIETADTGTLTLDLGYDPLITELIRINSNRTHLVSGNFQLGTKNNLLSNSNITSTTNLSFPLNSLYNFTTNTTLTVTLPAPSSTNAGARVAFNKTTAFSNTVTITTASGSIYDYNTRTSGNISLGSSDLFIELICNDSAWFTIQKF